MVTSLSHPNHLLQAVSQGIHCLIATKTTPNTIIASLDTIVWFTPTVPPLRAKHLLASHHRDILSRGASPTGTRFRNQMRRASCLGFCTGFCSYSRHVAVIRLLSTLPSRKTRVCYEVIFTETLHNQHIRVFRTMVLARVSHEYYLLCYSRQVSVGTFLAMLRSLIKSPLKEEFDSEMRID